MGETNLDRKSLVKCAICGRLVDAGYHNCKPAIPSQTNHSEYIYHNRGTVVTDLFTAPYAHALDRIAAALERIADAMEKH